LYTKVKLYGGQDVNYVWVKEGTSTNEEVTAVDNNKISTPTWDAKTIALAPFINGISASELNNTASIVGYKIQRKNVNDDVLYNVAELSSDKTRIQDYNISNRSTFEYHITPIYELNNVRTLGSPIITDPISTDWSAWSVVGTKLTNKEKVYTVDEDNIWSFELNIKSNALTPKFDKTFQDGFGRFPRASYGNRNYIEGGLETLIGKVSYNGEYTDDNIDLWEKWVQFCANGQLKLLKDRKGHVLPIDIKDTSPECMDDLSEQVTTISFNFVQLDDSKVISVYGLVV